MLEDIQWTEILSHLYHLGIAYLLAIPIGWDRESRAPGAGIRTFPLVAMASCAYMLTGIYVLEPDDARARVMYGILTGIGFIGGGSILKEKGNVAGTATAASIWSTGAIGIAVAWNRLEIALTLSIMTFLTLRFGKFLNGGTTEDQSR
ncbi:MgtC/SapB family protein [Candidatus Nitrospira salsa]|nr:MAG: magnesium transporter MgtC [Nitrospirales bacterium]